MKRTVVIIICVLVGLSMVLAQRGCNSTPADPDAVAKQIASAEPPPFDESKANDQKYVDSYLKQKQAFLNSMLDKIKDFYNQFPDHPQALRMMMERWVYLAQHGETATVLKETDKALARNLKPDERNDVLFIRAMSQVVALPETSQAKASSAVDAFVQAAPKDERGAELLFHLGEADPNKQNQIVTYRRIVDQYKESQIAIMAKGRLRQAESIGKPFELTFTDAISGKEISVQRDYKGKVVVIDFWATWCGPCVADMPNLKALYQKYKDKGVEIIGVSLDEPEADGGLAQLKQFVKDKQIEWPQYYQGKKWVSDFSFGWGIMQIPTTFIVDADGNLYSNDAFGKLDTLIPQALEKRDAKK